MSLKNTGKILKIHLGSKKVIVRTLDTKIEISREVYSKYNFKVSDYITSEILEEINKDKQLEKFFLYSISLINARAYTEGKLRNKLKDRGASKEEIENIINRLIDERLIDEESFLYDYVDLLHNKHYGIKRIQKCLVDKGFSKKAIALVQYDKEYEYLIAVDLASTYLSKHNNLPYNFLKKKLLTKLLQNGFYKDVAFDAINNVCIKIEGTDKNSLNQAYKVAKKKYKTNELSDKVINYLLRRGYCYNDILMLKGDNKDEVD